VDTPTEMKQDTSVVAVLTPTGLIVRGGPGLRSAGKGPWHMVADDFCPQTADHGRLVAILGDAVRDPVGAVMRHFAEPGLELFALLGPPGVIVGSRPRPVPTDDVLVWHADEQGVSIAFTREADARPGSQLLRIGTALCLGAEGPEILCDLERGTASAWSEPWYADYTGRPTERSSDLTAISASSSS
jgi:hypothetical protein